ncbi:extracellular solute-binding protein [Paenibacillus oceani]|uniref:Extracellular solute-binding protein n=1 Tax=Paenibacillus oceani TaxID=2772510 RepID=A0A927CE11_9BACL|nr:extracellular solute-binding protein [Paenibacillus oceani]MBD2864501.1 extracellular solute-binding protein [Paenibacillus oceani]
MKPKSRTWKPLTIPLAGSLALSLALAGCGGQPADNSNGAGGTPAAQQPAGSTKEKLTLNWFVTSEPNTNLQKDDFVLKTIQEKFNVELKLQHMSPGTDYDSKINVTLAGGDAPDMFFATGTASQKFAKDGLLADLTPFVNPQTMPNYFKYWFEEKNLKAYAVENGFFRAPYPYATRAYRSYYVRKDWLDKLNLKVPQTYDEMMNVMRAFTFNDPDGNGKKDTYGFSAAGNGRQLSYDFPQWIKNGLIGGFMLEGDQFVDTQSDIRLAKVFDEVVEMMKEGIVDPDWFLNKGTQHIDKAVQGKVGIILSDEKFALDSLATSYSNKTKSINPNADWVPFHPFKDTGIWTENVPGSPFLFPSSVAAKAPEKVKRSVEILDYLASPEGFLLTHYGLEGKHYTKNGDTITLNKAAIKSDIIDKGDFLNIWNFFTRVNEPERVGLTVVDPDMTDRDRQILQTIKSYKYIPSIQISAAPPAGVNIGDFRTKLYEYHAKLLFEEKSGANWPKYREEIMTKYRGKETFDFYAKQVSEALGKTYVFK